MTSVRCPIVELRQYTLHPGRRDDLIGLFERELIEPQEAAGMALVGQFRDLADPDRFVWLREFPERSAPEGESYRDFVARVESEFKMVIAQPRNAPLAVVTHRGVMQYALCRFFGFTRDEARKQTDNYGAIVVVNARRSARDRFHR